MVCAKDSNSGGPEPETEVEIQKLIRRQLWQWFINCGNQCHQPFQDLACHVGHRDFPSLTSFGSSDIWGIHFGFQEKGGHGAVGKRKIDNALENLVFASNFHLRLRASYSAMGFDSRFVRFKLDNSRNAFRIKSKT